jgi:hypothetical protein
MADRNFYNKSRVADVVAGIANFSAKVATDFESLGLTEEQSDAMGVLNATLQSSWTASVTPATRTPVAIQARGDALKAARDMAMHLSNIIYGTPAVSDSQLVALGLLPRGRRTRAQAITEMPKVTVLATQGRSVRIRVRDASGAVRGKLPSAVGALVYTFTGAAPPSGVEGWTQRGPITSDSMTVTFDGAAPGTMVWFAAQWFNSKGVGPGSTPVAAVIGAEGALAA